MKELVDDVLAERRRRDNRRRRLFAGAIALIGHTLLAALIALAPAFAARRRNQAPDFLRVMIVPAKALGDAAAPIKPSPAKAKPAKPAPELAVEPTVEKEAARAVPERQVVSGLKSRIRSSESEPTTAEEVTGATPEAESRQRRGAPDGSTFGTSPFGSSEASFDDPNFMYGYYVQQMLALIGSQWVRPRSSPGTEMIIHYTISRRGKLTGIEIVKESGNRAFDLAGFRAVTLASPLPPLPQSYRSDSLGVNLVIR